MAQSQDNTVGEVSLGPATRLVFSISLRSGQRFAHVRKFADTSRYSGPTPSGFAIAGNQLSRLVALLRELAASVPTAGQSHVGSVKKSKGSEFRVQVVPPDDDAPLPSIDIREHVTTASYVGFTKKGIRFQWDKLPQVLKQLELQLTMLGGTEETESAVFRDTGREAVGETPADEMRAGAQSPNDRMLGAIPDFPGQFLPDGCTLRTPVTLPTEPLQLKMARDGRWALESAAGLWRSVRNEIEGKYILFAQRRGHNSVALPTAMIDIFKTVAAYEKYCREQFQRVVRSFEARSQNYQLALFQTRQLFSRHNLPIDQ